MKTQLTTTADTVTYAIYVELLEEEEVDGSDQVWSIVEKIYTVVSAASAPLTAVHRVFDLADYWWRTLSQGVVKSEFGLPIPADFLRCSLYLETEDGYTLVDSQILDTFEMCCGAPMPVALDELVNRAERSGVNAHQRLTNLLEFSTEMMAETTENTVPRRSLRGNWARYGVERICNRLAQWRNADDEQRKEADKRWPGMAPQFLRDVFDAILDRTPVTDRAKIFQVLLANDARTLRSTVLTAEHGDRFVTDWRNAALLTNAVTTFETSI